MSHPTLALATTFARAAQPRPLAPEAILARAEQLLDRAGAAAGSGLVIDAHLDAERLAALIPLLEARREVLPVLALEHDSGLPGAPALASLEKDESQTAIARAEATLRRAAAVGAAHVVLRLGWVEGARRDWIYARDRFLRGALTSDLRRGLVAARDKVAPGHVDRARAALDRLCRVADGFGLTLLVKNGQRYVELPSGRELALLRSDLQGAPLAPLLYLPSAHLLDVMGMQALAVTTAAFGDGEIAYAGDACGAIAALPPGRGELGVTLSSLSDKAVRVFRPWPALDDDEIVLGLSRLR
jgi:hypothetical protein